MATDIGMTRIIRREDGTYFVGDLDGEGYPYEAYGPLVTLADAVTLRDLQHGLADLDLPDTTEAIAAFKDAHPDASLWSYENGDEEDIKSWSWATP